jgi:hypothetical protein
MTFDLGDYAVRFREAGAYGFSWLSPYCRRHVRGPLARWPD